MDIKSLKLSENMVTGIVAMGDMLLGLRVDWAPTVTIKALGRRGLISQDADGKDELSESGWDAYTALTGRARPSVVTIPDHIEITADFDADGSGEWTVTCRDEQAGFTYHSESEARLAASVHVCDVERAAYVEANPARFGLPDDRDPFEALAGLTVVDVSSDVEFLTPAPSDDVDQLILDRLMIRTARGVKVNMGYINTMSRIAEHNTARRADHADMRETVTRCYEGGTYGVIDDMVAAGEVSWQRGDKQKRIIRAIIRPTLGAKRKPSKHKR